MSKSICRLIIFYLVIGSILMAQDQKPVPLRQLQRGDRALQFSVRGLFNLSSFQGGTFSYKQHFSPKTALRIGLDVNLNNQALEGSEVRSLFSRTINFRDTTDFSYSEDEIYETKEDKKDISLGIATQWIVYPAPRGELQPYWGFGPTAHYSSRIASNELSSMDSTANPRTYRTETLAYDFGLSAVFGLEWFFKRSMSLHAEYYSSFLVRYSTSERYTLDINQNSYKDSNGEVTRWRLDTRERDSNKKSSSPGLVLKSVVKFGLSLYF